MQQIRNNPLGLFLAVPVLIGLPPIQFFAQRFQRSSLHAVLQLGVGPQHAALADDAGLLQHLGTHLVGAYLQLGRQLFQLQQRGGAYRLYASLRCEEMIARMVDAGIFKDDVNGND